MNGMPIGEPSALVSRLLLLVSCFCFFDSAFGQKSEGLTTLTWNIWKGGRVDGDEVGPRRVAEVIRTSGADLVALQETYGSGPFLAQDLGFHFHPRGRNVSILSRYPILKDISVGAEFQCVGALVNVPGIGPVAFYSLWLPYTREIWEKGTRSKGDVKALLDACSASEVPLRFLLVEFSKKLGDREYEGVPVVFAGDFNSMSHLDYSEMALDQFHAVVPFPNSIQLASLGFLDAWREVHPRINRAADRTWTPRFPDQEQDRIDFTYYQGGDLRAVEARRIEEHPDGFPSDHAGVLVRFQRDPNRGRRGDVSLRAVSYNIRHGLGQDQKVDLDRTRETLAGLKADIIALQEVDLGVKRSRGIHQTESLASSLGFHGAFGAFMPYQGGRYGMAILSKYPLRDVKPLVLKTGNEPRIALVAEVQLENGESVLVVNVHFDWVEDDTFRFEQATQVAEFLRDHRAISAKPYILLGDFNDQPGSRTLKLFDDLAREAAKPQDDRFTIPSDKPEREIDFIFAGPPAAWSIGKVVVVKEPLVSDHRPIVAELSLIDAKKTK